MRYRTSIPFNVSFTIDRVTMPRLRLALIATVASAPLAYYAYRAHWRDPYPAAVRQHLRQATYLRRGLASAAVTSASAASATAPSATAHYRLALAEADRAGMEPHAPASTGILVELGDFHSERAHWHDAAAAYAEALRRHVSRGAGHVAADPAAESRRRRAAGMAFKLGSCQRAMGDHARAEATWAWCVQELLGGATTTSTGYATNTGDLSAPTMEATHPMTTKTTPQPLHAQLVRDLGPCIEALGDLYAEQGRLDDARDTYLALLRVLSGGSGSGGAGSSMLASTLGTGAVTQTAWPCRAALIMNNLAAVEHQRRVLHTSQGQGQGMDTDTDTETRHWLDAAERQARSGIRARRFWRSAEDNEAGICERCLEAVAHNRRANNIPEVD